MKSLFRTKYLVKFSLFIALSALAVTSGPVRAKADTEKSNITFGLKASTLGVGAEVRAALSDQFALRVGGNWFDYNYDSTEDGIDYDLDLDLLSGAAYIYWHPFEGSFRLTGGLLYSGNEISALGTTTGNFEIGGGSFTPDQVGQLTGAITFKDIAPYAGIGWSKALGNSGLGFSFDLGVMFQGRPRVDLESTGGTLSNDPTLIAELAQEEQNLEDDIDFFRFYPVISLGLTYSF